MRVLQIKYGIRHRKNPQDWFITITVEWYTILLGIFIYLILHQIHQSNLLPNSDSRLVSLKDVTDFLRAVAHNSH